MKITFRLIALFLSVLILAVALCSCQALNDAKENRAVYTSADHTEIEYKGHIYRKMMDMGGYVFLNEGYGGYSSTVSEKDTPVLVAGAYGERMYVDNDEIYIRTSPSEHIRVYYVREDQYDAIDKASQAEKLDSYYLDYQAEVDYDNSYWAEYDSIVADDYHVVKLDDDAAKVVNNALNATIEDKISYKELSESYQKIIHLGTCDSNRILKEMVFDYYFLQDQNNYYFWDDHTLSDYRLVPMNEADSQIVAKLFSDYPEATYEGKISRLYD